MLNLLNNHASLTGQGHGTALRCWLETTLMGLAALALAGWLKPEDPLLTMAGFPWMLLPALLFSLSYGITHGFFFLSLLYAVGWLAQDIGQALDTIVAVSIQPLPQTHMIAFALLILLAGLFRSVWVRAIVREKTQADLNKKEHHALNRAYQLLQLTSTRLEKEQGLKETSLRTALKQLHQQLERSLQQSDQWQTTARHLLQVLARQCRIKSAALLAVDKHGKWSTEPLATIGNMTAIQPNDVLINEALQQRTLVSVQQEYLQHPTLLNQSPLIACAPVITRQGEWRALLVIQHMPFFLFNHENLRLVALILSEYGTYLEQATLKNQTNNPELTDFLATLQHWYQVGRQYGVCSTLLVLAEHREKALVFIDRLRKRLRFSDRVLDMQGNGNRRLVLLCLPMTDKDGLEQFKQRLVTRYLKPQGLTLANGGFVLRACFLKSRASPEKLSRFLAECGLSRVATDLIVKGIRHG